MTLEEFMQQQATQRGYTKSPLRYVYEGFDGGQEEIDQNRVDFQQLLPILKRIDPMYGVMEDYQVGEADAPSYAQRFASREEELKNAYYADPSNFIETRATPIATGINTFNEGNEDQKRIVDQINTGQLVIVPVTYTSDFLNSDAGAVQKQTTTGYELKDARTGQKIQDVTPVDAEKGIFNVVAIDRNSSGFFNNYVSTDPKGFVNPIVSEQQSQYESSPNSSLNFIKDSIKGLLSMAAIAATAGGAGATLGSVLGTGTTAGNLALNAGVNLLKQGVTGQFDPLGLATSTALSYGAGALGADAVPGGNEFAGMTSADLASLDATGLINSFADAGLTASEIDRLTREAVETGTQFDAYTSPIDTPVIVQPYDAQLIDPTTGEPFGSIEAPLVDNFVPAGNEFAGMSPTDLASLDSTGIYTPSGNEFAGMTSEDLARLDSTGIYTPAGNEFAGMTSEDLAKLDSTGTGSFGLSPMQALRGLSAAKSLLGTGQEQAAAPATQFRGTRMPSGQVDYSGILGLLQMQSPQRRSLLG
jgi:hypothetical protein